MLKSTMSAFHFFFGEERFTCTMGLVQEDKAKLCFSSGSRALFMGLASTLVRKKPLKLGITVLKIILLQYFQFSVK